MIRSCGCLVVALIVLLGAGAGGVVTTQLDDPATTGAASGSGTAAAGVMVRPVVGAAISQFYGCTAFAAEAVDTACPGGHFHSGIDLAAPLGTPVVAALDGTAHVVRSQFGFGLHIVLNDGGGLTTVYGHLSGVRVAEGEEVAAGDQIGEVGRPATPPARTCTSRCAPRGCPRTRCSTWCCRDAPPHPTPARRHGRIRV